MADWTRGRRAIGVLAAMLGACIPSATADEGIAPEDLAFFESEVRPVLAEHCYSCHAADAKSIRGGLVLDTKQGWIEGGDSGSAVEPGDPEASPLIWAVRYDDPILRMPPDGKLPDEAIAALEDWVARGAPDPRTGEPAPAPADRVIDLDAARSAWPFTRLERSEPPTPNGIDWCRNPIDRFILARLEAEGLSPSEMADRRVLIRRASYDLTGLPPTPEEVEAFENDPDPDAFDRVVDGLLDRPEYGERWARHWLDIARYAESHGFEHDYDRPSAYVYRDFVIKALNDDLPYDTFVTWQLAGDEVAPENPLAATATGFLAAGVHSTQITASQVEKERYDELDDMLNTTGTAFLGLTVGCARCHDHKFDPIPAEDYYRLLSTFTTTVRSEVDLDLDPEGHAEARARYDVAHAPFVAARLAFERDELPGNFDDWEADREAGAVPSAPWTVLDLTAFKSAGGATLTEQPDGSVLASGTNPDHETYTFDAEVDGGTIASIRLEALADPSLAKGGPGRASNGNFALTDLNISAHPNDAEGEASDLGLTNPRATFEQPGLPVAAVIDDDGTSAWAVDPRFGRDHAAAFDLVAPFEVERPTTLTVTMRFANNLHHSIGRPRLAFGAEVGLALDADALPQVVERALAVSKDERSPEQTSALLAWYRTIDPEWVALNTAEAEHAAGAPEPEVIKALISTEGLPAVRLHTQGADFLEETHILKRGDPNQKAGVASQGFLRVLMDEPEDAWRVEPPEGWRTSYRRASLAGWMTDPDGGAGHLLARVIVNRLWRHHFGVGIVATPSDFGAQGPDPTHPELLDWLAGELIRGGWRLKPIHRLMMTSATYRQGGDFDPSQNAIDPENLLHWRREPRRLEAEAVRDAMLAVSGLLDPRMYGPGTLDESMRRRSIYFAVKRSELIPMMTLFDAPDALTPIADRGATTVAPQSLYLLNSPIARDWAAAFASRIAPVDVEPAAVAVDRAYRLAFARPPTDAERSGAVAFLDQQASMAVGGLDAALVDFCQALLASNEFIFVE